MESQIKFYGASGILGELGVSFWPPLGLLGAISAATGCSCSVSESYYVSDPKLESASDPDSELQSDSESYADSCSDTT